MTTTATQNRVGEFYWAIFTRGETPLYMHPEGKRWGWVVERGELRGYLGPLHFISATPGRVRELAEYRAAEWAETVQELEGDRAVA